MLNPMATFSDPDTVARYAEATVRLVPGFHDLQRMTAVLLAERLQSTAQVLVLGAGGGLELKVFAELQPGWHFIGVDPSAEMLRLAERTIGALSDRIVLHEGYIDSAPEGPFDGATCLLTLRFVQHEHRIATLTALRKRLKPGAPLIVAHHSFPQSDDQKSLWLGRYAAFATMSGVSPEKMQTAARTIARDLPTLSPDQEEANLRLAGFTDVSLFYAAFSFRGWVAYA